MNEHDTHILFVLFCLVLKQCLVHQSPTLMRIDLGRDWQIYWEKIGVNKEERREIKYLRNVRKAL